MVLTNLHKNACAQTQTNKWLEIVARAMTLFN